MPSRPFAALWGRALRRLRGSVSLAAFRARHALSKRRRAYFGSAPERLLFLCHGNVCRSAFAERYWNAAPARRARASAGSAGFLNRPDRPSPGWMVALARVHAVDLGEHRSRVVTREQLRAADALFLMDRKNYGSLIEHYPEFASKAYFLGPFGGTAEIEDPDGKSLAAGARCCEQLARALDGLEQALGRG